MEGEYIGMKEIIVMVFAGNLVEMIKSSMNNAVVIDRFSKSQGYTIQQFSYSCERVRDQVGTAFGETQGVVIDFTVRVMTTRQTLFYEKLKDLDADYYTFVFNGVFEDDRPKYCDNAMIVDGFIVDVEESAANDNNQALMHVKLLARELTYIHHDGSELSINISNTH